MNLKNENELILKQWVRVFFLILLVAMIIISIWLMVSSTSKKSTKEELYTYSYNGNLDYKVYLKENSFFNSEYLGMNKQYISSLIDHITIDANYTFQTSKDIEYTYTYQVIATVKGSYQSSDSKSVELWSRDYTLLPSETKSETGKKFTISQSVDIDYNTYNEIMTQFRDAFGLSINASVDVSLQVTVTGNESGSDEETLNETQTFALNIPLLEQTTQITPDYINSGREVVYAPTSESSNISIPKLVIGILLFLLSIFLLKKLWSSLIKITKKSEYVIELNKILKEYADIIAESSNLPDLGKYDVVNIKHFHDLVDIEEELRSPILYNELVEDYESWFIIVRDNTAYKFVLRQSDLIKFNK